MGAYSRFGPCAQPARCRLEQMGFHTRDLRDGVEWLLAAVTFIKATYPLRQVHRISPGNGSPFDALGMHANLTTPFQKMYRYSA
jgi:hypothetical protein